MYKNKKILAFIPARSGSKRLLNKNKLLINNVPLFMYSVNVAHNSKYVDKIIVSSDSKEILDIAHKNGCIKNKLRPKELSSDYARIIDVMLYEIKVNNLSDFDAIVLLQPTFPFRSVEDLNNAIEKYFDSEESLITVVKVSEQPVFMRYIVDNKLKKIICDTSDIRSQDFKNVYKIIGSIYINNIHEINTNTILNENIIPYELDKKYDIDIDTKEDFDRAVKELKK